MNGVLSVIFYMYLRVLCLPVTVLFLVLGLLLGTGGGDFPILSVACFAVFAATLAVYLYAVAAYKQERKRAVRAYLAALQRYRVLLLEAAAKNEQNPWRLREFYYELYYRAYLRIEHLSPDGLLARAAEESFKKLSGVHKALDEGQAASGNLAQFEGEISAAIDQLRDAGQRTGCLEEE